MPARPDSRRKRPLLALLLILGFAGRVAAEEPGVTVEQTPPQVVRRTYDSRNPPAEMVKKLRLPEAGLCQFDFGCGIHVDTGRPRLGLPPDQVTVTSVRVVTRLDITIWTVTEANAKLRAHEEGHREICEEYYRQARAVALELARRALGTRVSLALKDGGSAALETPEALQNRLVAEFLRETAQRCIVANDHYDALTLHGGNPLPEADAVAQSVAEERARPRD